MTLARYVVIIERDSDADGGGGEHHNGTGVAAVGQLAKELQEAWDSGAVAGHFRIVGRVLVPDYGTPEFVDMCDVPAYYEDEPLDERMTALLELERSLRK